VLPHAQNIPGSVEITVEHHPATGTGVAAISESEVRLPMSTARAILRGVRGVHRRKLPTGPCCLVRKQVDELTPRRVMNTLGQTMVMRHSVDRQVLHRDEIKHIDDATTVLVGEVTPSPRNALMYPRHRVSVPGPLRRAFLQLAVRALYLRQRLFLAAEEAGIGNLSAGAEGGEGLESHVNTNLLSSYRQGRRLGALAGEADVPLARATPADGRGLGSSLNGTMQDDLDRANAVQPQPLGVHIQFAATRRLRIG